MRSEVYLNTQPGWTIATSMELQARGIEDQISTYHRDSSLLVAASSSLMHTRLLTPAEVCGCLLHVQRDQESDPSERLARKLDPKRLKDEILSWLPWTENAQRRQYCIVCEVYGRTSHSRKKLSTLIGLALRDAFPRWKQTAADGLRFSCKADPNACLLGIQLYTNLSRDGEHRPGTLREHLACGLLTMADVRPGDVVLDPLAGTGTILHMAWQRFDVRLCFGIEIDAAAYQMARTRLAGTTTRLFHGAFEQWHIPDLPEPLKVVSNLPFGITYRRAQTNRLVQFIFNGLKPAAVALLMSREQADEFQTISDLDRKNVLVLGQPASIVYRR